MREAMWQGLWSRVSSFVILTTNTFLAPLRHQAEQTVGINIGNHVPLPCLRESLRSRNLKEEKAPNTLKAVHSAFQPKEQRVEGGEEFGGFKKRRERSGSPGPWGPGKSGWGRAMRGQILRASWASLQGDNHWKL